MEIEFENGKDWGHFVEYKIKNSPYTIRVLKTEYEVQYTKTMTVEEVMEEIDREHGL